MKLRIITLLLLTMFVFGCKKEAVDVEIVRPVKVGKVVATSNKIINNFPGVIVSDKDVKLAFRVAGTIENLNFREGRYVEEGEVIASLDSRDYVLQVSATKAKYEEVQAEVSRIEELYNRNSVSQSDYDKAIAGKALALAKYQSAMNQLDDTNLIAPFSGYIQNIYFDSHETIAQGIPVISLVDVNDLKVETDIPSKMYLEADKFSSFTCHLEDNPNIDFKLSLDSIRKKSNMNELYKVIFTLNNKTSLSLASGMLVDVTIEIDNGEERNLIVPVNAVFHRDGKSYVWMFSNDNTVTKREVIPGDIVNNGKIIIKGSISEGDSIVTAGVHTLEEGQKVKTMTTSSEDNVGDLL